MLEFKWMEFSIGLSPWLYCLLMEMSRNTLRSLSRSEKFRAHLVLVDLIQQVSTHNLFVALLLHFSTQPLTFYPFHGIKGDIPFL